MLNEDGCIDGGAEQHRESEMAWSEGGNVARGREAEALDVNDGIETNRCKMVAAARAV